VIQPSALAAQRRNLATAIMHPRVIQEKAVIALVKLGNAVLVTN